MSVGSVGFWLEGGRAMTVRAKHKMRLAQADAPEAPSFDSALKSLLGGEPSRAAAQFAARALADPKDWISRANRAIALYDAGRWPEAAKALEAEIARAGARDPLTVPAL